MNEKSSLPERDAASSLQRHRRDSPLLQRGIEHLVRLEELSSSSELAVDNAESPLLWSFAAYSSDLEDVVAKRPSASLVISENIPDELKERRQWICWEWVYSGPNSKREYGGEEWTACPISPITGSRNWYSSDKWGSFTEALTFMEDHGLAGIAFVISKDDPYVVVDLTNCRDSTTGALNAVAARIVAAFSSYSESSPSGVGVRIFARSQLESVDVFWTVEHYDVHEYDYYLWPWMFHRDWFFPMTGQRIPNTPLMIQERDEELRSLQEFDSERPFLRHPPTAESKAMIKKCQLVDHAVFVSIDPGVDVCLDAKTGERIHDAIIASEPPTYDSSYTMDNILIEWNDFVEVPSPCVWATDTLSEEELWYFPHEDSPIYHSTKCSSVSVKDGVVYLNVDIDDDLFALDARSGRVLWHFRDSRVLSVEVADGIAYVRASDGIYALGAIDGREMWRLGIKIDKWISHNIMSDSRFYEMDAESKLHAVHPITGVLHWECTLPSGAEVISEQNGLVMFRASSSLGAIDAETGVIRWEVEGGFRMVAGQSVYASDDGNSVVALESASGHERWRFEIGDTVRFLTVADDVVLVAGQHVLYVFRHV